jgi:sortase A
MISKTLILIGILCLGVYGFFTVRADVQQVVLQGELDHPEIAPISLSTPPPPKIVKEGSLFGRLEIPRLDMSVMVMEGDGENTLRLGAGHMQGTPLAIAGHRDSFFRPLKDIRISDTILLTTPEGSQEYRVTSTKIVDPTDTSVLDVQSDETLTLITCYPFYYVGPAPKRFIVEATRS